MLIALLCVIYLIIGIITGVGCYVFVFDSECDEGDILSVFAGILWFVSIPLGLLGYGICKFCKYVYIAMNHIKHEGFHYCKEDIPNCCGKCKHITYLNFHNECHRCDIHRKTSYTSTEVPCEDFKLNPWWRFKIRIENK